MVQLSLDSQSTELFVDASAIINILSSGFAEEIIDAIQNPIRVAVVVCEELAESRELGWPHADLLTSLRDMRLVETVELEGVAVSVFERLVLGHGADTLDDGEAATIACAVKSSGVVITDDRKALRVAEGLFPGVCRGSSMDLFRLPSVAERLGPTRQVEALFNALIHARMRVPEAHLDWAVEALGPERVTMCPSLPKKTRK